MDFTDKIEEKKDNVIIPIKTENSPKIKKIDSKVYHNGKHLLYEPDTTWDICCIKADKDLIQYAGKFLISILVLLFCMYMLQQTDQSGKEYYSAQISFILGVYVGIQGSNNNKNEKQQ